MSSRAKYSPSLEYHHKRNKLSRLRKKSSLPCVTTSQFESILKHKRFPRVASLESVAKAISDLSFKLVRLDSVLRHIFRFRSTLRVSEHQVEPLSYLLEVACIAESPDILFLLLTIAAKMISYGSSCKKSALKSFISTCKDLLQKNPYFVTFVSNQSAAFVEIRKMLELFEKALRHEHIPPYKITQQKTDFSFGSHFVEDFLSKCYPYSPEDNFNDFQAGQLQANISAIEANPEMSPSDLNLSINESLINSEYIEEDSLDSVSNSDLEPNLNLGHANSLEILLSSATSEERITEGQILFPKLPKSQQGLFISLASNFTGWETAYPAAVKVWECVKSNQEFNVNILISQIKLCFADFLVAALRGFAKDEGIEPPVMIDPNSRLVKNRIKQ